MDQKIIQVGNSAGIIIPKALLDQLNLEPGSQVVVQEDLTAGAIIITKKGTKTTSINSNFLDILEKVNKEYGPALKELAKK